MTKRTLRQIFDSRANVNLTSAEGEHVLLMGKDTFTEVVSELIEQIEEEYEDGEDESYSCGC